MGNIVARLFRRVVRSDASKPRASSGQVLILLALLLVALGSVAYGLADIIRALDTKLLLTAAVLGALVGWMMATIHLSGRLAGILAPSLGVVVVLVRVGRLGGKLAAIGWTLVGLIEEIWRWLLSEGWRIEGGVWRPAGPPPNWMTVPLALTELWTGIDTLLDRARGWVLGLVAGHPTFDPVATALLWSLAVWVAAVWAGWAVRHHRALQGIAPAGTLLMAAFFYTGAKTTALLTLLGTTLLLMVMTQHNVREYRWRAIGIDFSPDLLKDLAVAALLSLALVVTAALAPSISVQKIVEFTQQLIAKQKAETDLIANSLGLELQPNPEKTAPRRVRTAVMPRFHAVSLRPQLSQDVVMVIRTSDPEPGPRKLRIAPADRDLLGLSEPPLRYYWRSITYDNYTGRGWTTSPTEKVEYKADEPVVSEDAPFHRVLWQEVRIVGDLSGVLYVAGTLVTADRDFSVAWRSPQEDAFGASIQATTYRADSLVPVVSEKQLRSAGSNYPKWIRARYLALPDQVPERVLVLARDLTATRSTPYDRALAIESYLRENFSYTLDVHLPPSRRDIADYFLFDLQEGRCDYYATSMAVLARAAGLPARLVVGYTSGTYNEDRARYVVTKANAHAWVEVYFPKYGWIEFEPTAGRPPIERPAELPEIEEPEPAEPLSPREPLKPVSAVLSRVARILGLGVLGSLVLVSLVSIIRLVVDGWRLHLLTPAAAVATIYRRLQRHGRRLAVPMQKGDTPHEFVRSFVKHFADQARNKYWWDTALAPAVQEVQWLTSLYVRASYTPHPPNTDDQRQAIRTWRRLRGRLWLAWVLLGRYRRKLYRPLPDRYLKALGLK